MRPGNHLQIEELQILPQTSASPISIHGIWHAIALVDVIFEHGFNQILQAVVGGVGGVGAVGTYSPIQTVLTVLVLHTIHGL